MDLLFEYYYTEMIEICNDIINYQYSILLFIFIIYLILFSFYIIDKKKKDQNEKYNKIMDINMIKKLKD